VTIAERRDLLHPRDKLAGAEGDRVCVAAVLAGNLMLPSGRAGWGAGNAPDWGNEEVIS